MDEITFLFFEQNPGSRYLHYRRKQIELEQGRSMRAFVDEARRSGCRLTFAVAVDAWVCPIELDLGTRPGKDFTENIFDFTAGMCHRIQAEIDDMLLCWPSLGEPDKWAMYGGSG